MTRLRIVRAAAPIRICDNGGWTDTWVARHGKVFNIAVQPLVNVRVDVVRRGARDDHVVLNAKNFATRYAVSVDRTTSGPHPLLEAAIRRVRPPDDIDVEISISSDAPAGAATGTSAAVTVALLGALHRLAGNVPAPVDIAKEAHSIETDDLRQQSGVQDQLASACGGVNFIDIPEYPHAIVTPLKMNDALIDELNRRLALVYIGRPHNSSAVHERVVGDLQRAGTECRPLQSLRRAAEQARDAVLAGDLTALGRTMRDNTDAQAELHADLVSKDAWRVIEIARAHDAAGWKVNGAGGDGGSVTLLGSSDQTARQAMLDAMLQDNPSLRTIPIAISCEGLRVDDRSRTTD